MFHCGFCRVQFIILFIVIAVIINRIQLDVALTHFIYDKQKHEILCTLDARSLFIPELNKIFQLLRCKINAVTATLALATYYSVWNLNNNNN